MLKAGDTFHRYRIAGKLGEGGMGLVYRAYDPILHREIALKIVRAEVARTPSGELSEAAIRLMREGRAVASLNHPNAIGIFDVGEINGTPYIAMELAIGKLLTTFIGDRRVSMMQRLSWLSQIAHGLDAAHKQGLVHRDVKPDNIMVCDDGEVKILDFGVVKRIAAPVVDQPDPPQSEPLMTRVGVVMGTPLYMAPEQALGEAIDGRSDQFSWATMAYELLSGGIHPTTANNPRKLPIAFALLQGEPKPLAEVTPDLPEGVDAVVMRALAKSPAERFATMEEIFVELDAILDADADADSDADSDSDSDSVDEHDEPTRAVAPDPKSAAAKFLLEKAKGEPDEAPPSVTTVRPMWADAPVAEAHDASEVADGGYVDDAGYGGEVPDTPGALDARKRGLRAVRLALLAFATLAILSAGFVGYRFMLK